MISLSLLYFRKPFCNVNCWHKSLTPTYFVIQIIHCNICKFSMSISMLSLTKKKTLLQIKLQLCDSQTWAWTCIVASCITSTLVIFVAYSKCLYLIFCVNHEDKPLFVLQIISPPCGLNMLLSLKGPNFQVMLQVMTIPQLPNLFINIYSLEPRNPRCSLEFQ